MIRCIDARQFIAAGIAIAACGCLKPPPPTQQVQDFVNLENCVQAHWGEPITNLAADCLQSEVAAAEDVVADIEAIAEGQAILRGGDGNKTRDVFPYTETRIIALVEAKRAAYLTGNRVPPRKGS